MILPLDFGGKTFAQSPHPTLAAPAIGRQTSFSYDEIGRIAQQTSGNTGAYTKYIYPPSQNVAVTKTTITDVNNNGADVADEVTNETYFDGAGRTRMSRSDLPNGNYVGQMVEYNQLGQAKRQTVPTEVNGNWMPSGDDYRGVDANNNPIWLWTAQRYDWKGRVVRKINTDGSDSETLNASNELISRMRKHF